jgi:hypothetical protein
MHPGLMIPHPEGAHHPEVLMTPRIFRRFGIAVTAMTAAILATLSFAYASSSTVDPGRSGDGLAGISGYVIENVSYHVAPSSTQIESISFDLDAAAASVKIQLAVGQDGWYDCRNTGGYHWSCNTDGVTLSEANQLRVAASGT